jgi:hypothetical protein
MASAWIKFAVNHFEKNKHKPGYTYSMALKEAGKLYKKGTDSSSSTSTMKKSKRKGKKNKTARRS